MKHDWRGRGSEHVHVLLWSDEDLKKPEFKDHNKVNLYSTRNEKKIIEETESYMQLGYLCINKIARKSKQT